MSRAGLILLLLAALLVVFVGVLSLRDSDRLEHDDALRVVLAYAPRLLDGHGASLAAWVSVLEEEGVPCETADLYALQDVAPEQFVRTVPALVLPDGVCRRTPSSFTPWLERYLRAGGSLAVVHDAAVMSQGGSFLPRSALAGLSGVQHVDYTDDGAEAFTHGAIRFVDAAAARRCGIPPGKLDDTLSLCGYGYGRLEYPVARSRLVATDHGGAPEVLAWAEVADGRRYPAVTRVDAWAGSVVHFNLPLGDLKAGGDDLPLRALARFWLFDVVGLPHLLATPRGLGGLVLNWHVDAGDDRAVMERFLDAGCVRASLPASVHVTAGPDLDAEGDGLGFDACGRARALTARLASVSTLGSHGGWIHNRFARAVGAGEWGRDEIRAMIVRNTDCLSGITGAPLTEYSAPAGVHPPVLMAGLLEELGFDSYYFTGDSGGSPTRSFHDGRRLSDRLIAFPVAPLGRVASFGEMDAALRLPAAELSAWLSGLTDFCERERAVRLVYSHPYNLYLYQGDEDYLPAYLAWLDGLEARVADRRLQVRPMHEYAAHLRRMLAAEARWTVRPGGLTLALRCPDGLRDLALTLPADRYLPPSAAGLDVRTADGWITVVIEEDRVETTLDIDRR